MGDIALRDSSASTVLDVHSAGDPGALIGALVQAHSQVDQATFQRLLQLAEKSVAEVGRDTSYKFAALRGGSSSSGGSNRSSTDQSGRSRQSGVGLANTRLDHIKKVASWRKRVLPDGLCYARIFKDSSVPHITERLGKWPSLASILELPVSQFRSMSDLESFRVVGDAQLAHVKETGCEGTQFLSSASRVAQGFKHSPGSFGAVLKACGYTAPVAGVRLMARTALGGELQGQDLLASVSPVPSAAAGVCVIRTVRSGIALSLLEKCKLKFLTSSVINEFSDYYVSSFFYTDAAIPYLPTVLAELDHEFLGFRLPSPCVVGEYSVADYGGMSFSQVLGAEGRRVSMSALVKQRDSGVSLSGDSAPLPFGMTVGTSALPEGTIVLSPVGEGSTVGRRVVVPLRFHGSDSYYSSMRRVPGATRVVAFSQRDYNVLTHVYDPRSVDLVTDALPKRARSVVVYAPTEDQGYDLQRVLSWVFRAYESVEVLPSLGKPHSGFQSELAKLFDSSLSVSASAGLSIGIDYRVNKI